MIFDRCFQFFWFRDPNIVEDQPVYAIVFLCPLIMPWKKEEFSSPSTTHFSFALCLRSSDLHSSISLMVFSQTSRSLASVSVSAIVSAFRSNFSTFSISSFNNPLFFFETSAHQGLIAILIALSLAANSLSGG
ncbi:hypothetical protein HanHA300_Chr09g0340161 [Helianthus annuus]|nr:hypothetical protein HanHA300_Chr09g0340161 [Helianthus annuus]KAJ0544413.1 hypothetical protein HanHA89_Chr09g0361431 [Helianthus annuus]KAJ0709416.1 hypothetical protein HanLR1_Chr09g0340171 [Helianthus annuus]